MCSYISSENGNEMRKEDNAKTRVCVQYDDHSRLMCTVLCSLMEHQSLVDLAIRCGNNTMHAHKCILAASSPYFREQLEKNPGTEQVIINGLDFVTMKSVIEFIYCGETNILEEHLKAVIAAAKLFQIRGLQALASEAHFESDESIQIPPPIFMNKKPKYSSAYIPYVPNSTQNMPHEKTIVPTDVNYRRLKRKYVRTTIEAEKACAREARASRMALEALKKELGPTNQMHNFEIEDTCTETTVENFIPHADDETFMSELDGMPLQVMNYTDLNAPILTSSGQIINLPKVMGNNMIPIGMSTPREKAVNKIKDAFSQEMQTNVEIMYKTPEGDFVKVTDEVLRNITSESLQFQVIDENGREGEIQLLDDKIKPEELDKSKTKFEETFREFINTTYSDGTSTNITQDPCDLDSILLNLQDMEPKHDKSLNIPSDVEEVAHFSKFDKIIVDINEETPISDTKMECTVDEDYDVHRANSLTATDDHTDILKEINSMQYYDKSVYEDMEPAYSETEVTPVKFDQPIDNFMNEVEQVAATELDDLPSKKMRMRRAKSPLLDMMELSPKYSPRKTRSARCFLSDSSEDLIKGLDYKKKVLNKKK